MKEDKLMPLAAKMVDLLKADQERKLARSKGLLNKTKELEDRLNEFQETKQIVSEK